MRIPDCFNIDFTQTLAKVARFDGGAIEYTEIYQIMDSPNEFWFSCNCTNFTLTQIYNSGSINSSTCIPSNKYFKLYNYQDGQLTQMIFKSESSLEPALGCLNDCQSCLPSDKSYCTACIQPLLSQNGKCKSECSSTFFRFGFLCRSCPENCNNCESETTCSQCVDGFSLLDNKCYATCPQTYFSEAAQCVQCSQNCLNCKNMTNCTQCAEGY